MGATRAQKVRLGVFVGLGLLVLVGGLVALAGARLGEERDAYVVRYAEGTVSLSGLEVGSPVKYSGIRVGRVDTIGIAADDLSVVEVGISLTRGTPVAKDSEASLGSMGITGLKYIELTRGTREAGIREPGDRIPPGSSGIDELTNRAGEIAEKVSTTLDRVNALVAPDMKDRVASILDRTDRLLETLEATVTENRVAVKGLVAEAERLTAEVADIAETTNGLLARAAPGIDRSLRAVTRLMGQLEGTRENLDATLASADAMMQSANDALVGALPLIDQSSLMVQQSRENLVESLGFLRETAENLSDFSRRVREDPSLLLLGDEEAR